MPYIIDGHNLIGKIHAIDLQDLDDELQLINLLESYFRGIRKKATIYFDRGSLIGNDSFASAFLDIHFVRPPLTADEEIIHQLREQKGNARNYTVISSDNWVISNARRMGAQTLSSSKFAKIISKKRANLEKKTPGGDLDVDEWLKFFNKDS